MTYGFLSVMVVSLITLAVLQYHWLGSVSEAEKERLEESMTAASENFVADFNRVFTDLGQQFRLQVSEQDPGYDELLSAAQQVWLSTTSHKDLVEQVYVVRKIGEDSPSVFEFSSDAVTLEAVTPDPSLKSWLDTNFNKTRPGISKLPLRVHPDLGEQTFLSVPVQLLNMVQVSNFQTSRNIEVRLKLDQLDDIVLLRLNDEYIKNEVIPEIAGTYFSESFNEQYYLTLLEDKDEPYVYFSNGDSGNLPEPDFSRSLDRFDVSSIFLVGSGNNELSNVHLPSNSDSIEISFSGTTSNRSSYSYSTSSSGVPEEVGTGHTSVWSERYTTFQDIDSLDKVFSVDTTVTSSMVGSISGSSWKLWLTFKEGSLDAFVNKTRSRNLIISFGILGILGISVVLIVIFSQRSRELADQQMMFVAGVSHELRTPLTVIRSAAENLTEGVVQDEKRTKEYAKLMLKEGRRLSDMVDQIMEFSGIQTGKRVYNFTQVDLNIFLESVKEESRLMLEDKQMQMEYSLNSKRTEVTADPDALFLSVSNLINNAIKFSGESKKIILKVDDDTLRGKPAIRIQVQDFGIGIPEHEQREIFKPFFRGKKPADDQLKGNGIGLSLVDKVAKAHNGEVRLRSRVDEGSVFELIIPKERKNE
jgi:signal transduction histidine kinase